MGWSQEETVFIRNQQLDLGSSADGVSVIHFIRLLEEEERARVRLDGGELVVVDKGGQTHRLGLNSQRRLSDWPVALELLGYRKRVNSETGIIDYRLASEVDQAQVPTPRESEELRLERSLRRPGYRKAKKNYEKILTQIGRSKDEAARERVRRLGQLIAEQSPLRGLKWNFEVIGTKIPNALCTGEGHVIVTTGLLDLNLSDDELAGVLGHEVAHGVRRHAEIYEERFNEYRAMRAQYLELQYEYRKSEERQNRAKIQDLESKIKSKKNRYEFVVNYLKNKKDYDQDEEEESDVLGMQYAAAAGFDPEGEARALTKLKARSVQLFGQSYDSASRTHPPLERRLQILEIVRRRWREERKNR